ncbi:MAG TPA: Na/Pi cotransporter family protein [Steroidobacteraceae bacterium]|jgi:phosphate:Na+ symporter|nr:Na/Pi cotransporter family protein [Steroidobacteraceae bacterium]
MGSTVILDLMGGVALLLWGLHMVHSGIVRAFGADLRRLLGIALQNRFRAFLAGAFVTALLQSSTATGLMAASFVTGGTVDLVPALAVMLGANVGTTLVVQVLSFNIAVLTPILLLTGVIAFKRGGRTWTRDLGRAAIGIGLMLLALHIFLGALTMTESSAAARALLSAITGQPMLCLLVAAAFTWAAHSSVAIVLVVMSLGAAQLISPTAVIAMVLGANIGSALNPLIEASQPGNPASRRLPVGNVLTRLVGCALVLPFLHQIADALQQFEPNSARLAADFHTTFNIVLAMVFIGPLDLVARMLTRWLPDQPKAADPATPVYLDSSAAGTPAVALVCAAREVLRTGDLIETMLRQAMTALLTNDRKLVAEISRMDDAVDSLNDAVKLYVTRMTRDSLDDRDGFRAMEIISFSINLEHVGDIIDKNLMDLASKKIRRGITFSKEGEADLVEFHQQVVDSLKLAVGIFMSGDMNIARQLIAAKTQLREREFAAAERYLARLREGTPETIESYSLDLDILRDLKRIHSHLCSAAYPVLERAGALQRSRLKDSAADRRKTAAPRAPTKPRAS